MTIRERAEAKRRAEEAAKGGASRPSNPPPATEGERGRSAPTQAASTGHPDRRLESTEPDLPYGIPSAAGAAPSPDHLALTARASQLCIWVEPPPSNQAWVAARLDESTQLVLIVRLPLAYRPPNGSDPSIPF